MTKDQVYEAAVERGTKLLELFTNHTKAIPQSDFTDPEDLDDSGYVANDEYLFADVERLSTPFRDLGANSKMDYHGGKNILVHHLYNQGFTNDKRIRPYFAQICNPEAGIIVAEGNLTVPVAAIFEEVSIEMPLLRHWSDIAFLQYLSTFPSPPPQPLPLKYIFRLTIMNATTCEVLKSVIAKQGVEEYSLWPGLTFDIESEEGRAILGSPNGAGVAWMLLQHKTQLGEKKIEKVTVFYATGQSDLFRWPSLLFWFAQVDGEGGVQPYNCMVCTD
ncbi:hypothetical protein PTMSG1_06227 [Pyrenophora teres f. maculata]|nr:hypothetical protein PTMSG1_06227 [Pyrenophora teres f. maculata]